jgi:AP-4 complex subunit sigma-1
MFNIDKAHYLLEEMVLNGCIIESNKGNILSPVQKLDEVKS